MKAFLDDNTSLTCDCTGSPFLHKDHKQIVTGDFKNIDNNKLWKLLSKSSKYRKNRVADYQKVKKAKLQE